MRLQPATFWWIGVRQVPRDNSRQMEQPLKVKITKSEIAGDYLVAERNEDGLVLLAPDTSIEGITERLGTKPASEAEFAELAREMAAPDGEG